MYFLLNPVTCLIVPWLLENINATRCPTDRLAWEARAGNFTCDESSFVYHCILDDTGRLMETCAARVPVPVGKHGCPVIRFIDGVAYHLDDNSECPLTNPACPSGKSPYYSDQLYLYPVCLLNKGDRSSYGRDTTFGYEFSTKKTTYGYKKAVVNNNNNTGVIVVLILSLSASVVVNIVLIYKCYKGKRNKEIGGQDEKVSLTEETERNGRAVHDDRRV